MADKIKLNSRLNDSIAAVCPIDGVALLDLGKHQVRVDYKADATAEQREAAQLVLEAFDWSDDAQKIFDAQIVANRWAADPLVQYILAQIKVAVPSYEIPTKESIGNKILESTKDD